MPRPPAGRAVPPSRPYEDYDDRYERDRGNNRSERSDRNRENGKDRDRDQNRGRSDRDRDCDRDRDRDRCDRDDDDNYCPKPPKPNASQLAQQSYEEAERQRDSPRNDDEEIVEKPKNVNYVAKFGLALPSMVRPPAVKSTNKEISNSSNISPPKSPQHSEREIINFPITDQLKTENVPSFDDLKNSDFESIQTSKIRPPQRRNEASPPLSLSNSRAISTHVSPDNSKSTTPRRLKSPVPPARDMDRLNRSERERIEYDKYEKESENDLSRERDREREREKERDRYERDREKDRTERSDRDRNRHDDRSKPIDEKGAQRERIRALASVMSGTSAPKEKEKLPLKSDSAGNSIKMRGEPIPIETTASATEMHSTLNVIASDTQLSTLFDCITLADAIVQKLKGLEQTDRCKNINKHARSVRQMLLEYHTQLASQVLANDEKLEIEHYQQIQESQDIFNYQQQSDYDLSSYNPYNENCQSQYEIGIDRERKFKQKISSRPNDSIDPPPSLTSSSPIVNNSSSSNVRHSSKRELADPTSAITILQKQQQAAMRKKEIEHPDTQHYS